MQLGLSRRKFLPFRSLQNKILMISLILVLPICAILVYFNVYAKEAIRNQVAYSNKNLLSLYLGTVDRGLHDVDKYLYKLIAHDNDLLFLEQLEQEDTTVYNLARIRVLNKLTEDIAYFEHVDMLFVYSIANQDLLSLESKSLSFQQIDEIKQDMTSILTQTPDLNTANWFIQEHGESAYLCRLLRFGNVYIGSAITIDKLMLPFASTDLGKAGKVFIVNDSNQAVIDAPSLDALGIQLRNVEDTYYMTGKPDKFMLVHEQSEFGSFGVYAMIPEWQIMGDMPYLRRIVIMIVIGTLVVLPLVYALLRIVVLMPMRQIVLAMKSIRAGNLKTRMQVRGSSSEYAIVTDTFNTMMDEIHKLKINVYEEQLATQRSELKHLQLQINPHFLLNSLNIVYHLASVKNLALIQEMILCLVQYFRFMFRSNSHFVSLSDELDHTRNYLTIQQMRFPEKLNFEIACSDALITAKVPPLICQTFVENAIKYAVSMDRLTAIMIRIETDQSDARYMWIEIRDTGSGFKPDILEKLQREEDLDGEDGSQIGIRNVRSRLRLMYPNYETRLQFCNDPGGGAIVTMRLPIIHYDTEEAPHHVSDIARG